MLPIYSYHEEEDWGHQKKTSEYPHPHHLAQGTVHTLPLRIHLRFSHSEREVTKFIDDSVIIYLGAVKH